MTNLSQTPTKASLARSALEKARAKHSALYADWIDARGLAKCEAWLEMNKAAERLNYLTATAAELAAQEGQES